MILLLIRIPANESSEAADDASHAWAAATHAGDLVGVPGSDFGLAPPWLWQASGE